MRVTRARSSAGALDDTAGPPDDTDDQPPYVMSGWEIPFSLVLGENSSRKPLRARETSPGELAEVLEQVLVPSLNRPPCVVAFSGGRDSSAILAAATHAARRHGLPLPVPVTNRFPSSPDTDESEWQEMVIDHLGLEDWVRVDLSDELDVIGPLAGPVLRRYGVLWPMNSHFLLPAIAHAGEGTVLTGTGGDELFLPSAERAALILNRQIRPRRSDALVLARAFGPRYFRTRQVVPRIEPLSWLRPAANRERSVTLARMLAHEPLWWGRSVVEHWWRSRARLALVYSIDALGRAAQVRVEHPFMHPDFLTAIAGAFWRTGFASRELAMDLIVGDGLPLPVRRRTDKIAFFQPFFHRHSREFVAGWNGAGVDEAIVDVEALRRTWSEGEVDGRSYSLLQSAWLHAQGEALSEPLEAP